MPAVCRQGVTMKWFRFLLSLALALPAIAAEPAKPVHKTFFDFGCRRYQPASTDPTLIALIAQIANKPAQQGIDPATLTLLIQQRQGPDPAMLAVQQQQLGVLQQIYGILAAQQGQHPAAPAPTNPTNPPVIVLGPGGQANPSPVTPAPAPNPSPIVLIQPQQPLSPQVQPLQPLSPQVQPLQPLNPQVQPLQPLPPTVTPLQPLAPQVTPLQPLSPAPNVAPAPVVPAPATPAPAPPSTPQQLNPALPGPLPARADSYIRYSRQARVVHATYPPQQLKR